MIVSFVVWWALLGLLGQAFAPAARRLFPTFPDRGLAAAKPLALVVATYVSWISSHAGLPHRASLGVAVALLGLLWVATRRASPMVPATEIVRSEAVFLAALLAFALLRSLQPAIFGAEKYMDFALFNACWRAPSMPPEDPWLAGAALHYYYFGYLLFANLARLADVPPEIAYNLSLATVGAILFTGITSLGRALTGSTALGLVGGLAAAVLGNLDGALQILEGRGIDGFDYWRSSRVVPNTINEFPFFSLLHGDLHPHVTGLVAFVSLLLVGAAAWLEGEPAPEAPLREHLLRPGRLAVAVVLLAAVSLGNPWDLPAALAFLGFVAAARLWSRSRRLAPLAVAGVGLLALLGAASVLTLPFTLRYEAPVSGVGRVSSWTEPDDFVVVFGALLLAPVVWLAREAVRFLPAPEDLRDLALSAGAFAVVVLYLAVGHAVLLLTAALLALSILAAARRAHETAAVSLALVATAALLLLACEVVFLRDAYGAALHRQNTVFKLYFQAWVLLAAAVPWFAGAFASVVPRVEVRAAVAAALLLATLCYPAATIAQRWRSAPFSLDGLAYLDREHPDDAAAIRWLRENVEGRAVVLEATGDPYSDFARVSSNTGLPTVLGWANHEGVWRGADSRIASRRRNVPRLYETTDRAEAKRLLRAYGIRYVFVGELERRHHPGPGLEKFAGWPGLFREAFHAGATVVYEVESAR